MDNRVHLRDGVTFGCQLLPVKFQGHLAGGIEFARYELKLYEKPGRATGIVMAFLTWLWANDVSHQESHFCRSKEFTGALAGTLGEFSEQVFVRTAQEIRLYVSESKPVARIRKGLHYFAQLGRID